MEEELSADFCKDFRQKSTHVLHMGALQSAAKSSCPSSAAPVPTLSRPAPNSEHRESSPHFPLPSSSDASKGDVIGERGDKC